MFSIFGSAHLAYLFHKLRASFWVVPVSFSVAALALAWTLLWLDTFEATATLDRFGPPFTMQLDTARQLLSTLAGAVVTVVGLVFSLTLVTLTVATGNLGARLLERYMGNRITQTTMGLFIGTFIFVVVSLSALGAGDQALPRLTVLTSVLLSIACVVWLSFAFHDLAKRLQIDQESARIAKTLVAGITDAARHGDGWEADDGHDSGEDAFDGAAIASGATGYVQAIDFSRLAALSCQGECQIRLAVRQGDYVIPTDTVIFVQGNGPAVSAIEAELATIFTVGMKRTETEDLLFHVHLLLEIAGRALSPGLNDRYTALSCIDHLTGSIEQAVAQRLAGRQFRDSGGTVRVRTRVAGAVDIIDTTFSALRHDIQDHPLMIAHCLDGIRRIAAGPLDPRSAAALSAHVELLRQAGLAAASLEHDREHLSNAAQRALDAVTAATRRTA